MARRLSGTKAMPARRASAVLRKASLAAGQHERAAVGPELAEQRAGQLELPAAHEAVDAEHLAGAHVERDVAKAAAERRARLPPAPPAVAPAAAARCRAV